MGQQKDNIYNTVSIALMYLKKYRLEYVRALCIPAILVSAALSIIPENSEDMSGIHYFLIFFMIFVYSFWIVIVTHRITLLGPESVNKWGIYIPGKRELYFILNILGFCLIAIPLVFLAIIPTIGHLISYVAICYLIARISLVFPAIATDTKYSLKTAWKATKDHQLYLIVIFLVLPFVLNLPLELIALIPNSEFLILFLNVIINVFAIVMLSIAFKTIEII